MYWEVALQAGLGSIKNPKGYELNYNSYITGLSRFFNVPLSRLERRKTALYYGIGILVAHENYRIEASSFSNGATFDTIFPASYTGDKLVWITNGI